MVKRMQPQASPARDPHERPRNVAAAATGQEQAKCLEESVDRRPRSGYLDCHSAPGLFLSEGKVAFWIVRNAVGSFAIQLDRGANEAPYVHRSLTDRPLTRGTHLGSVHLRVYMEAPADVIAGLAGVIVAAGSHLYLTVPDAEGVRRLPLNETAQAHVFVAAHYPAWALELTSGVVHSYLNPAASVCLKQSSRGDPMARDVLAESKILRL